MTSILQEIPAAAVDTLQRDGVVKLESVFSPCWIEQLRHGTELAMARPGEWSEEYAKGGGRFFGDLNLWLQYEPFRQFVFHSPAAEIAGRLMQSRTSVFFYDQLLVKEPGTDEATPWHQDQPYWAVSGRQVVSIWLPLDTVPQASSLRFVRGSHRWEAFNPHHFSDDSPYEGTGLPELPEIDDSLDQYEILSWPMEPGDCLVFQAMIVHGSGGNASTRHRRRALATRWIGDDARFCERPGECAIPTFETGLKEGDRFEGDLFPLVWSA